MHRSFAPLRMTIIGVFIVCSAFAFADTGENQKSKAIRAVMDAQVNYRQITASRTGRDEN